MSALIAAVASVVSAVVTAVVTLAATNDSPDDAAGAPASAASPVASEALAPHPETEPGVATTEAVPSSGGVPRKRYEGKVSITNQGERDLDRNPPINVEAGGGGDFSYNIINGKVYTEGSAVWAKWESDGLPSYAGCAGYVDAAAVSTMALSVGEVVCLRTGEGRVGRMRLIEYPDCYCAVFDAVIWEQ